MKVPLFDITRQHAEIEDELLGRAAAVVRSGRYILGPEVEAFEEAAAKRLGLEPGVFVSSGSDALLVGLMAMGIGPGDEVVLPAFTFFATAGAVARLGARPVFADVCPVCFNLDADSLAERVTDRTRAIIPVHLFGQSAEMGPIMEVAREHGLKVLEDCAQSYGAEHRGSAVGAIGDLSAFSFFPTKNLGGFGDSGMVMGTDGALLGRVRRLRQHGMNPKYHHREIGGNFRGDPLQAALLGAKLGRLDRWLEARAANAGRYLEALGSEDGVVRADADDCACLRGSGAVLRDDGTKLILPVGYPHNRHTWNQFTVRVPGGRRDALVAGLREAGVGCEIYYPVPLHRQECFGNFSPDSCPMADRLADEVVSLPIFPELRGEEQETVIGVLTEWIRNQ